jgi:hypothetical protein
MKTKKPTKIILITLGTLIALAISVVIFVPGLPFYIIYKNSFPILHIHYTEFTAYDVGFVEETILAEHEGLAAYLPADFTHKKDSRLTEFFYINEQTDETLVISKYGQDIEGDFNLREHAGIDEKNARRFFRSVGREIPQSMFETVYIWNSTTWDDFRLTTSNRAFYALAVIKESLDRYLENGEYYYYENEHIKGFIFISQKNENTISFMGDFFYTNDQNKGMLISITVRDTKTAWAFINSIRIP